MYGRGGNEIPFRLKAACAKNIGPNKYTEAKSKRNDSKRIYIYMYDS